MLLMQAYKIKFTFSLLLILIGVQACTSLSRKDSGEDEVFFRVKDKVLTKNDIDAVMARKEASSDSIAYLHKYLKNWAIDQLLLSKAEDNIRNWEQIDSLVADFRRTLLVSMYQENLLKERLSNEITQEQLHIYYEKNPSIFVLKQNLVRGVFLKVPLDAPNIGKLKNWMKRLSSDDVEKIEKYSILNAQIYDYFLDKWVGLSEILRAIPVILKEPQEKLLKNDELIEGTDDRFIYLLRVKEYKLIGEKAPFDFVKPQIEEILLNQRKNQFLLDFRKELYEKALESGDIVLSDEKI